MLTMGELAEKSHNMAVEKGWYEIENGKPVSRSLVTLVNLFHSEVSEILEAYRDSNHIPGEIWFSGTGAPAGKPEGVTIEIADLFLRIADAAKIENGFSNIFDKRHCNNLTDYSVKDSSDLYYQQLFFEMFGMVMAEGIPSFEGMISSSHSILSRYFDKPTDDASYWSLLEFLLVIWSHYCSSMNWNLEEAIRVKMAYNSTRPHRHGNKRL